MCFCNAIPTVPNRTEVIVLQHMRERFHAFNTARIVRKALTRCTLLVDHNHSLADRLDDFPLTDRSGVLYPGPGGRLLTELGPAECPDQLIVIDGTWHHAKTLLRDIPRLNELPRYRIQPSEPGRYRIRREPNETALSTLEATVAALRAIEPDTQGLDALVSAFDAMVESQLDHPTARTSYRKNRNRQQNTMGIPRALLHRPNDDALNHLVVVYGESQPGRVGCKRTPRGQDRRQPVYWVAQRVGTGESFCVAIESPVELTDDFFDHLGLPPDLWRNAKRPSEFNQLWRHFIRPTDSVIAYHPGTFKLLRNVGADVPNPVILKSIKFDPMKQHASLESFLRANQIETPASESPGRAGQRLANAIGLTRYLNGLGRP